MNPADRFPHAAWTGPGWTLLPRHGARPLGFYGRLLLDACDRDAGRFLWSEVAVYEPAETAGAGPGYVVAVRHRGGEHDAPIWQHAVACRDAPAVHDFLRAHDPAAVMPAGMLAAAGILSGADALLAATRATVGAQRRGWQALLAAILAPIPRKVLT